MKFKLKKVWYEKITSEQFEKMKKFKIKIDNKVSDSCTYNIEINEIKDLIDIINIFESDLIISEESLTIYDDYIE
jgi:hypothetical protein